jgi:dTDP-glucose 4,6-dehydratase
MRKILVTGGCGFIGSNFIRFFLRNHKDARVINLDALTYAGNLENLKDLQGDSRYIFIKGNICDKTLLEEILSGEKIDAILNFAAETHVDRSIYDAEIFIKTNFYGVYVLLEAVKKFRVKRFVQISTDEVYGSIPDGEFTEESPLNPSNPYSATKAAADLLVKSYHKTFRTPSLIIRSSNNFGPYQFPEKIIPLFITNALEDKELPLYGDGLNRRDWLFVEDNCRGIEMILQKGKDGEIYNLAGENEMTNLELTKMILSMLGKPFGLIRYVKDRPGHDRRYAMSSKKAEELGWRPQKRMEDALEETIRWYKNNKEWVQNVKNTEYLNYYKRHYGK